MGSNLFELGCEDFFFFRWVVGRVNGILGVWGLG